MSMAILGSLCMYLSARYAQKSWIKSNRIPYWICFFLFCSIASQILVTICYTHIIGIWCDMILVTLSIVFAWKQYRKLNMVLQWSIVDLRVNGDIELLDRHVRMKRRFNRIFTTIWIGISFLSMAIFVYVIARTTKFMFHISNQPFTERLLCNTSYISYFDSNAFVFADSVIELLLLLGMLFGSIFYIGYGLCTMYVLLWRLCKGNLKLVVYVIGRAENSSAVITAILKCMLLTANFQFCLEWVILNLKLVICIIYSNISKIV